MSGACRTWSSGKIEPSCLQIGGKAETLRHGKLAGDILAPANAFTWRINVVVLEAAGSNRLTGAATVVVGANFVFQIRIIVAFAMNHDRRRQSHRDGTAEHRPANGETSNGIDTRRQREQGRDALDMAAHVADRTG